MEDDSEGSVTKAHLDSVAVDTDKDNRDQDNNGDRDTDDDHDHEGGLGHGVPGHNVLQQTIASHSGALALGVGGVGEDEITESS